MKYSFSTKYYGRVKKNDQWLQYKAQPCGITKKLFQYANFHVKLTNCIWKKCNIANIRLKSFFISMVGLYKLSCDSTCTITTLSAWFCVSSYGFSSKSRVPLTLIFNEGFTEISHENPEITIILLERTPKIVYYYMRSPIKLCVGHVKNREAQKNTELTLKFVCNLWKQKLIQSCQAIGYRIFFFTDKEKTVETVLKSYDLNIKSYLTKQRILCPLFGVFTMLLLLFLSA